MKTLKYAVRFLMRAKAYTIINLLGLSFSLACCLMLARYIHRELTVDAHAIQPETMVCVLEDRNGNVILSENPKSDKGLKGLPANQIVESCRTVFLNDHSIKKEDRTYKVDMLAADSLFFHFFTYSMYGGQCSLKEPNKVLISHEFATLLFGKENPIGKQLQLAGMDVSVGGIFLRPQCKTMLNFDVLVPLHLKQGKYAWTKAETELIRVLPSTDLEEQNEMSNVYQETTHLGEIRHRFIHWCDLYFDSSISTHYGTMLAKGNLTYIYILCGVVVLLFLVGIINFVNLYMVYMQKRMRSYGIKKVFGLHKGSLFLEIWLENLLVVASAIMVAAVLLFLVYQFAFTEWMHTGLTAFDYWMVLGLLIVLPLLTSVYPFVRYNYSSPITSIYQLETNKTSIAARMTFLFMQYSISIFLMVVSFYFVQHLQKLIHSSPGYEVENRLTADLMMERAGSHQRANWKDFFQKINSLKQALDACPLIESWNISSESIAGSTGVLTNLVNDKDKKVQVQMMWLSPEFFQLYGLQAVEGSLEMSEGGFYKKSIILNETAMKVMGYNHLDEAFVRGEKPLWMAVIRGQVIEGGTELMPVQAVIKDYYPGHLAEGIPPMAFILKREGIDGKVHIHVKEGKEKEIIPFLRNLKEDIYGVPDLEYAWLQEDIDKLYEADCQVMQIYTSFAGVAIVISCMGLFGLSLFDIRRRYKEIGIRKVNGAKVKDIWLLLFRKYVLVLLAAFAVASPLAVYFITSYTEGFAVKAPLGVGVFVLALLLVAIISMGTMCWQVNRAALINPAEVIKSE